MFYNFSNFFIQSNSGSPALHKYNIAFYRIHQNSNRLQSTVGLPHQDNSSNQDMRNKQHQHDSKNETTQSNTSKIIYRYQHTQLK